MMDGTPCLEGFLSDNETEILMEKTRHQETVSRLEHGILFPEENDILLGRGRPYQEFSGNRNLARLISDRKEEYKASGKLGKTELTNTILQDMKRCGGRFLKKSEDGIYWVLVNDEIAREKGECIAEHTTKFFATSNRHSHVWFFTESES